MVTESKIYRNTVGLVIIVNCGQDISEATVTKLIVKKPDGTEVEWIADVYQNNYLRYTTQEGDLDQVGQYELQAYVEIGGWKGRGKTASFIVYENYT